MKTLKSSTSNQSASYDPLPFSRSFITENGGASLAEASLRALGYLRVVFVLGDSVGNTLHSSAGDVAEHTGVPRVMMALTLEHLVAMGAAIREDEGYVLEPTSLLTLSVRDIFHYFRCTVAQPIDGGHGEIDPLDTLLELHFRGN